MQNQTMSISLLSSPGYNINKRESKFVSDNDKSSTFQRKPLTNIQLNTMKLNSSSISTTTSAAEFKVSKPKIIRTKSVPNAFTTPTPKNNNLHIHHTTTTTSTTTATLVTPTKKSSTESTTLLSSSPFIESPDKTNTVKQSSTLDKQHQSKQQEHHSEQQHQQQEQLSLDDFEFGKVLGKGKLGRVYCVKHKKLGLIFALKVMSKEDLTSLKLEKNFKREVEIQSELYHKNITRLYSWFHDSKNIYLILEFSLEGELYNTLKKFKRFDNSITSYYIFQITQALIYLHLKNIIHRDLKPENIMLSLDNCLKLSDFGWSAYAKNKRRLTLCGTLDYLAPEMIESKDHDFGVDIWALGILCFELLVGKPPFEAINRDITYEKIVRVDIKYPSYLDPDAVDLISKLLVKDPAKRITLKDVLHHKWILKNKPKWGRHHHSYK